MKNTMVKVVKSKVNPELARRESGLDTLEYVLKVTYLLHKKGYKNRIRRYADRKNYNATVIGGWVNVQGIGYTSWDSFTHLFLRNLDCDFVTEI